MDAEPPQMSGVVDDRSERKLTFQVYHGKGPQETTPFAATVRAYNDVSRLIG